MNRLLPGQRLATPVLIGEVGVAAGFIVVHRRTPVHPKHTRIWLEAPDGTVITPGVDAGLLPNVEFVAGPDHQYFRWLFRAFPADPKGHIGAWKVLGRERVSDRRPRLRSRAIGGQSGVQGHGQGPKRSPPRGAAHAVDLLPWFDGARRPGSVAVRRAVRPRRRPGRVHHPARRRGSHDHAPRRQLGRLCRGLHRHPHPRRRFVPRGDRGAGDESKV